MNEMLIFGLVVAGLLLITWLAEKQQKKQIVFFTRTFYSKMVFFTRGNKDG